MSQDAESKVKFGDHLSGTVTRNGKLIGFSESHGRGRAAHGTIDDTGSASFGIAGSSSHGEDGTLEASKFLVQALNESGGSWEEPVLVSASNVDAISQGSESGTPAELKIQVVRAIVDNDIWKALGSDNEVERSSMTPAQIAQFVKDAIALKATKIPPADRAEIALVLNAIDTPVICFDDVVSAFSTEYGTWAESLGFRDIWVVGPWTSMAKRLACAPP